MIEVNNLTGSSIDKEFLKKVAKKVLKKERFPGANLSIALVGPTTMRKLNRQYQGKNRVTDVLAFGQNQKLQFITPPNKKKELGEIVICLREVKKNAKRFKTGFQKELILCLIHGILHLLGYEHEKSEAKAKKMEEKQNYYLELWQEPI